MRGTLRALAVFCLSTTALAAPVFAASFSVGGGTITTTQADNSVDNTGTGGAFQLQANTVSSGDAIAISNVNTTALDVGNLLPSTGSYSVTMQGSTLSSYTFFRSINGGPISFDSTGGAANTLSGSVALNVGVNSGSGGVSIKTGADVINGIGAGAGGIAISAVGSGTVSVDTIGATITSTGLYGIVAQSGNGDVIIGGSNGGMASTVTANNGYGIYATSSANVRVTIAPSGSITALNGIYTGGIAQIDNFGTLAAANNAIDASSFGQLTATLEAGSSTSGRLLGGPGGDTFNIVAGANITNATFDGGPNTDTLGLQGMGTASIDLSKVSNVENLQKDQAGTWTLLGTGSLTSVVLNAGVLKTGSATALSSGTFFTVNGGTFDLNGNNVAVGVLSGTGGVVALGPNTLTATISNFNTDLASVITGTGSMIKAGPGTLTLSGNNTYSGGTVITFGALGLGSSTGAGSGSIALAGSGFVELDYANGINVANAVTIGNSSAQFNVATGTAFQSGIISETGGSQSLVKFGFGTLVLNGNNTYSGGADIRFGAVQVSADQNLGDPNGAIRLGSNAALRFGAAFTLSASRAIIVNTAQGAAGYIDTNGFNITLAQGISGTGSFSKTGAGVLTLGSVSTYSGSTDVNQGTLRLGLDNALPSNSLSVTGTLDLNNHNQTIGALDGTGNVTLGSGTLTVTGGGVIWNGVISGTGNVVVTKTLAVTNDNTYTGGTTVTSTGSLIIGVNGASGSIVGNIIDNGTLTFERVGPALIFPGVISGTGSVIQDNLGTTVLTGTNTYSGATTIGGGDTLALSGAGGIAASSAVVDGGTFDISGITASGTGIRALTGTGSVVLGGKTLIITAGAGIFSGDASISAGGGSLEVAGGSAIFTGAINAPVTVDSGATIQIGIGGTAGSINGPITDNGTLIYNRSDNISLPLIPGGGNLTQAGSGTLTISVPAFFNTITIGAGTVQVLDFGNLGNASINDKAALVFNITNSVSAQILNGGISGSGSLTVTGGGTLYLQGVNSYSGPTAIGSNSFLQVGDGITHGTIGSGAITNNGTLLFDRSDTITVSNAISGSGAFYQTGSGTLILTGADTSTGAIFIDGRGQPNGTLQIGNGGTSGSIVGNITDNGALVFNHSDDVTFAGVISGTGTVAQAGNGTLTLSGTNSYAGNTLVNAGTLNVTGKIGGSSVTVANGATLSGTGKVGATTISGGGTLIPGSATAPGTLSVTGNLTLAPGSNYLDVITPTVAGLTSVSGAASLNGSVIARVGSGTYAFGQRYTLINAAGGVSGTFASLTGIPLSLKGQLSYDANNAYLTLSPNALAPQLASATGNQHNVVSAIDASVATGNIPPTGFTALYSLSGPALNNALDQISGQAAPNVINAVGNSFLSFMSMTAAGGGGDIGNFAPGSAYGKADAPHRAQLGSGQMRIWGAAYGGHVGLSGDSASGAASLSSNNVGMIGGADMKVADNILAGVTLGLGRQQFHSGNGSGDSSDFMFGLYGRAEVDAAYVTASFGFGWHQIKTLRLVTVSGTDVLQGKQNADDFGGRVEAGWHLPLDDSYTVTPYAAFAGESFESPAYAETALSGASTFALSYTAQTTTLGRSELGAHLDRRYALEQGMLIADVRTAWAHQLDDLPFTQATFLSLPGAAFQVAGVRPASDTALLGLDLDVQNSSGLFFGIHGEGQFGAGTTAVEGLGNFGWRW